MRGLRLAVTLLAVALPTVARTQTSLAVGDGAIVGLWSDDLSGTGGGPKSFAFATFVDLAPGTVVSFTDNGWMPSPPLPAFRLGEGVVSLTLGAAGMTAGSVAVLSGNAGPFNLSTAGDQIFAFQGSIDGLSGVLTGTLLFGLNDNGTPGAWQVNAADTNTSALPSELGSANIALAELDNYAYTGPLSGTVAELQTAVSNPANWTGSDTTQPAFPTGFTVTASAIPALGATWTGGLIALLAAAVTAGGSRALRASRRNGLH